MPSSDVLVEQRAEHGAGLTSVFREHVPLLDVLGPFAASQRLGVEGDVTDDVEGVEILAQLLDDHGKRQALGRQLIDDRLLALRGLPTAQEVVKAREAPAQGLPREVRAATRSPACRGRRGM